MRDLNNTLLVVLGREEAKLLKQFLDSPRDFVITPEWKRIYDKVKEAAEDTTIPVPFGSNWNTLENMWHDPSNAAQQMVLHRDSRGDGDEYFGQGTD